jgi:hypothetical protein
MKKLILVAALTTALAACNNKTETPAAEDTATAEATPAATTPASSAGTYEVTTKDGTKFTSTLNPDGTYQDTDAAGKVSEKGMWADKDGKTCIDPEGDEAGTCYTVGAAQADGTQVATPDDGSDPVTIKKTA